ncbi:WhiB family transcriptional regulator [Streptomyces zaomyceticus]|uniref:WhiB family transcriptional regulator n=1 Tax=Streptomyces zaomyceticus TaxID=68286 RepID=UPI0037923C1E
MIPQTPTEANWQRHAPCNVDPDLFFPDPGTPDEQINMAKQICGGCPVRQTCLDEAIRRNDQAAICGGLTPDERNGLLRPNASLNRFQQKRVDSNVARSVAMDHGADLLVWLVKREMPVAVAAEQLGVSPRAVFHAFAMLVPPAQDREHLPSAVERVLGESSLTLRTMQRMGRSHEEIARWLATSQNVVSASLRVLEQRDAAMGRISRRGIEDAVQRMQAAETRVRRESRVGLTVQDVIAMAGPRILALHGAGSPLRQVALDLGLNREAVRKAYLAMTKPKKTQDDMDKAA